MKAFLYVLILSLPDIALGSIGNLQKGISVTDENIVVISQTSWEYAKSSTTQEKFNDGFAVSFLRVDESADLYSLSSSNNLYLTNFDTRDILGNWPLTRWQYEPIEQQVKNASSAVGGTWNSLHQYIESSLGCLSKTPLRYGDLESDGSNELVIFIGNVLFVFSPDRGVTAFMVDLNVSGWMTSDETKEHFLIYPNFSSDNDIPQYQMGFNPDYIDALPVLRGYAKLYVGDFDKNGQSDILVWRKLYDSNMQNNPVKGFHKLKDSFYHYEKSTAAGSTGEYLPQETDPGTIQSWLATNTLTWQQGYPSKSECEGEEGQLIPEMHDPLLNDPDVLH